MTYQPMMTQLERMTRRRKIAERVRSGCSFDEAARDFGVSTALVRLACNEHGVLLPPPKRGFFGILRELVKTTDSLGEIARRLGINTSRVWFVYEGAVKAGVAMHSRAKP